jgi:thiosulfate/3-mercaptopyruvate sulfurtransferase
MAAVQLAFLALSMSIQAPARPAAQAAVVPTFVSAGWLASNLADPKLVVLNVGPKPSYDSLHIPGARFADLHSLMGAHEGDLALELPEPARLDSVLEQLGISNDSKVVIYTSNWVTPAARYGLTLEWAGMGGRVGMLEGGLAAWQRNGGTVTAEVPSASRGSFTVTPHPELFADAKLIRASLGTSRITIVDARDAGFYLDTLKTGMPRGGHIPGAHSIPYTSLTDEQDMLKPAAELHRIFRAAGAAPGKPVVVYCHIGQQGSWVRLVARSLGYDARLYDGSFQEWSRNADWPVEGEKRAAAGAAQ